MAVSELVTALLQAKNKKSGGHNGSYIPELLQELKVPYSKIIEPLNELHKEKKITIHPGSQGKLIFWGKPKQKI